jgi:hypothetical protein
MWRIKGMLEKDEFPERSIFCTLLQYFVIVLFTQNDKVHTSSFSVSDSIGWKSMPKTLQSMWI